MPIDEYSRPEQIVLPKKEKKLKEPKKPDPLLLSLETSYIDDDQFTLHFRSSCAKIEDKNNLKNDKNSEKEEKTEDLLLNCKTEIFNNTKKQFEKQNKEVKYEFQPKLFNTVDLSTTAGFGSKSSIVILIFALLSAATQFIMSRQQDPSRQKGKKRRTMRQLMKEAAAGKEADQSEINAVAQGQMTWMMPFMMLMIMINLPGAIVFYYLLNNIITVVIY